MEVELELVVATKAQIDELFEQLSKRVHKISHEVLPLYESHHAFVTKHPYRAWFLVRVDGNVIGNVYVQNDNSIGLNNLDGADVEIIGRVLNKLKSRLKPLEPIPSVRFKDFFLNVAATNDELQSKLEKLGYKPSQISYVSV